MPPPVAALGHAGYVSGLGEWSPIMDGGAWLTIAGTAVDVLFGDLDRVDAWLADAEEGRFDVVMQNRYIVGAPTDLPVGELATCPARNETRLIERAGLGIEPLSAR